MKINTDIGHTIGRTPLVQLKNIAKGLGAKVSIHWAASKTVSDGA